MRIGDILGAQFITIVLAAIASTQTLLSDELSPMRPERRNSSVNDTYACVQYRNVLSLSSGPVIYFVGTSCEPTTGCHLMGTNVQVETTEGDFRIHQILGEAGVRMNDRIDFSITEPQRPLRWHFDGEQRLIILVGSVRELSDTEALVRFRTGDPLADQAQNTKLRKALIEAGATSGAGAEVVSWYDENLRLLHFMINESDWFAVSIEEFSVSRETRLEAINAGLGNDLTRLAVLQFLISDSSPLPLDSLHSLVKRNDVNDLVRAHAAFVLAKAGEMSVKSVLSDLSLCHHEETREIARNGLSALQEHARKQRG